MKMRTTRKENTIISADSDFFFSSIELSKGGTVLIPSVLLLAAVLVVVPVGRTVDNVPPDGLAPVLTIVNLLDELVADVGGVVIVVVH